MVSEAMKEKIDRQLKNIDFRVLTDTEKETIELRLQYHTDKEIAQIKGVSRQYVNLQIKSAIKKSLSPSKYLHDGLAKSTFDIYVRAQLAPIKIQTRLIRLSDNDTKEFNDLSKKLNEAKQLLCDMDDVVLSAEQQDILNKKRSAAELSLQNAKVMKEHDKGYKRAPKNESKEPKPEKGILLICDGDENRFIKIGKRDVCIIDFKKAVSVSRTVRDVCNVLGFNATVGTTKQAIKDRIDELGLDTAHFKWNYTVSEAVLNRSIKRQFHLNEDNQKYYDAFEEYRAGIDKVSWATYKSSIGNHMETLKDRDFATLTVDEIEGYSNSCKNSKNVIAHLRSLLIFIVQNDVNGALEKAERKTLAWLISKPRE